MTDTVDPTRRASTTTMHDAVELARSEPELHLVYVQPRPRQFWPTYGIEGPHRRARTLARKAATFALAVFALWAATLGVTALLRALGAHA